MAEPNYAVVQRLRMIDFLVAQYGAVNRRAIVDFFGVSEPTASHDFASYMEMAPGNIVYDKSARTYVRGATFERVWT
ncbi:hypothetical protein [Paraburkholderia sp. J10-1]|uniref:hypothetical protein n=1 Tax=Paraburkholderia sp. J10-1 TaxID=2805430 RepID=UPI002AB7E883|nr:hypothetical protein [Paraburkholderia sp. J10-1]